MWTKKTFAEAILDNFCYDEDLKSIESEHTRFNSKIAVCMEFLGKVKDEDKQYTSSRDVTLFQSRLDDSHVFTLRNLMDLLPDEEENEFDYHNILSSIMKTMNLQHFPHTIDLHNAPFLRLVENEAGFICGDYLYISFNGLMEELYKINPLIKMYDFIKYIRDQNLMINRGDSITIFGQSFLVVLPGYYGINVKSILKDLDYNPINDIPRLLDGLLDDDEDEKEDQNDNQLFTKTTRNSRDYNWCDDWDQRFADVIFWTLGQISVTTKSIISTWHMGFPEADRILNWMHRHNIIGEKKMRKGGRTVLPRSQDDISQVVLGELMDYGYKLEDVSKVLRQKFSNDDILFDHHNAGDKPYKVQDKKFADIIMWALGSFDISGNRIRKEFNISSAYATEAMKDLENLGIIGKKPESKWESRRVIPSIYDDLYPEVKNFLNRHGYNESDIKKTLALESSKT